MRPEFVLPGQAPGGFVAARKRSQGAGLVFGVASRVR